MAQRIYVRNGIVSSGMDLSNSADCFVLAGGTILDTRISDNAKTTVIAGNAYDTCVSSGGTLTIRQNSIASDTTVSSGGIMRVSAGATAIRTTYMPGASGGVSANMNDVTLSSGAQLTIVSGATITDLKIENGGRMLLTLGKGVSVSGVSAGVPLAIGNSLISDYSMTSGNRVILCTGATAANVCFESGSELYVSNGVELCGVHIDGDVVDCSFELDTNSEFLDCDFGGRAFAMENGVVSGLYIPSKGSLILSSGVVANDIAYHGTNMVVNDGAVVYSSYINAGIEEMSGRMSSCILGSRAYVSLTNGFMCDITVEPGGRLYAGGTLSGEIRVGGTIFLQQDTVVGSGTGLLIDISGHTAAENTIVASFQNATFGDYELMIGARQTAGIYILADNVGTFVPTLSVTMDDSYLGELTVEGKTLLTRSGQYVLSVDENSCLVVTVTEGPSTVYVNSAWDDLADGTEVQISETVTAVIGYSAFASYDLASQKVAYGGTVINVGETAPVFSGDMVEITVKDDCYLTNPDAVLSEVVAAGTVFCGIDSGSLPASASRNIRADHVSAKRLFAAGYAEDASDTDTAEITLSIEDSTLSSGLFGGAQISNPSQGSSTLKYNTTVSVSASTASLLFGSCNILSVSGNPYEVAITGDVEISLDNVTAGNYAAGGSLIGSYAQEDRTGKTSITVSGGTCGQLVGGSLIQSYNGYAEGKLSSTIRGDITISIGGSAKIGQVYGGSIALKLGPTRKESVIGNISILIDITEGASVSKMIFAGGGGYCSVNGDTSVTITGSGSGHDFFGTNVISGDSAYARAGMESVTGDRSLNFKNFNGVIQSNIMLISTITVDSLSEVTFKYVSSQLSEVNTWDISADSADRVSVNFAATHTETADYDFCLDFAGSEFRLSCDLQDGDEWTVIQTSGNSVISNLAEATFFLNGEEFEEMDTNLFESESYRLEYRENGALVVSKIA